MWWLLLPPASMIAPALVMSCVTCNGPSMFTAPSRLMFPLVTLTALSVTTASVPPTLMATVPVGNVME
ncbi:hypothetical protein D3C87_2173300 [compost metagenome]